MTTEAGVQRSGASGELLAEQVREHGRLFFRLAYGVLRDEQAAEDACQQAILKALEQQQPQDLENPAALRAWLAKVVLNESLQVLRRRRTEQRVMEVMDQQGRAGPREHNPAEHDLLRQSVLDAMLRLPEDLRLVAALRIMEGLRGNEVKDLLGCSASEVSRQLHQAMERLRVLLADWNAS